MSPGKLIDVGGCRLSARVTGRGERPAVVMVSCSGGGHDEWQQVRERLGDDVVCLSYGRPGIAGSDPLPASVGAAAEVTSWAAGQLHDLLAAVGVPPPYVLVGSSIGGFIVDRFLRAWPDEVAGLVQVDATFIRLIPGLSREDTIEDADDDRGFCWSWDRSMAELQDDPPVPPERAIVLSKAFGSVPAEVVAEVWHPLSAAEVDEGWRECQREWARRLDAVHIAADTAGHLIHVQEPGLVAYAVRAVIDAARAGRRLNLDSRPPGGHVLSTGTEVG